MTKLFHKASILWLSGLMILLVVQPSFAQGYNAVLLSILQGEYAPVLFFSLFYNAITLLVLVGGTAVVTLQHINKSEQQYWDGRSREPLSLILSVAATLCLLVALVLPFVFFVMFSSGYLDFTWFAGFSFIGWWALIPVLAFAGAAVVRAMPALAPYRQLADKIAFVAFGALLVRSVVSWFINLVWGVLFGNVITLFLPHIGVVFVIAAPILLYIAHSKEK